MENKIFILNQAEKVIRGDTTDFLDPNELNQVASILNKNYIKYNIFKLFNDAEKNIIYKNDLPNITLLKINTDNSLNHKDILGALFSHNIKISKYGDILIDGDNYYLPILDSIKSYMLSNFNMIGNNYIKLSEVKLDTIKNFEYHFKTVEILVSSLRIDNIVSTITSSSRNQVDEYFKLKYVFVNYLPVLKKTYIIKENDIIGIRRNGKYRFNKILKVTSKNKYIIELLKYE